jgi:LPXTG-site transpeptidase (sortase) family protein
MAEESNRKFPRRLLTVAACVAFLGGLALLAIGVISIVGTGSEAHAPVVDLGNQQQRDLLLGTPKPSASATPVPGPPLGDAAYQMVIDHIGVNAPVRTYGLDPATLSTAPAPEVPTGPDAASIVAWYDFSAKPGTTGNAIFAGHVTWFGSAVFINLESAAAGDVVKLIGQDGTEVDYTVSSVFQIDPNDPNALYLLHQTDTPVLTIITCGGTFVKTDDPVFGGEYTNRVVLRADLASVKHPGAPAAAALGG